MPRPTPIYVKSLDDDVVFRLDLIPGTDDYNWTKIPASTLPPGTRVLPSAPAGGRVTHMSRIVAAYVANNSVPPAALPDLMLTTHKALSDLAQPALMADPAITKPTPAHIRRSITPEHLVSFEDGKPYKTLRRHLTLRGLTPEQYRAKWGLPADYPMTAAGYSARRSELARRLGLGQQRRTPPAPSEPVPPKPVPPEPGQPKRTGRRRRATAPK